jgi:hypothetical protein
VIKSGKKIWEKLVACMDNEKTVRNFGGEARMEVGLLL